MSQIIRQNADRKIKSIFELFIKQKFDLKFVLFSIGQTLQSKTKLLTSYVCNLQAVKKKERKIEYFSVITGVVI